MKAVKLTQMVEEMNLKNLTPNVDMEKIRITLPDINRPALRLPGILNILLQNECRSSVTWSIPI